MNMQVIRLQDGEEIYGLLIEYRGANVVVDQYLWDEDKKDYEFFYQRIIPYREVQNISSIDM